MTKVYIAEYTGLANTDDTDIDAIAVPPTVEQVVDSAAATGAIATLGAITGGTLYTNGVYNNVPLTGGTGSGATANITVAGGAVTAVNIVNAGNGYTVSDNLSAAAANIGGTGSGFTVPVATIYHVSTAFQPTTTFVEISTDGICSLAWGTNPVATTNNMRYAANERRRLGIPKGANYKVSVITNT